MRNNIYNPLFESLLKKVNDYENPQGITEQDAATGDNEDNMFANYMKSISQLGAKLIAQYANAIQTYPKTQVKSEYMKTFPDKLKAMVNSIDDNVNPGVQLDALFKTVKAEATAFFGLGAKEDKRLVKHLEPWRDAFRTGFQLYTQAFNSLMVYVKKKEVNNEAGIGKQGQQMMKAAANKFVTALIASFEENKTITDTKWGEPVVGESLINNSVLEKLIQNKVCVDFNTFNIVINEAKEDRVARRSARAARTNIETLQANLSNVLNQIGGRLGDPAKANFKSLAMAPEFNKIANTLVSIQDELSVDDKELKNVQFKDLDKQIENLTDLFKAKKESYDKAYAEEEKSLRSYKTLQIATPEVVKFIEDGDAQFSALSDLAQNGANLFSADLETAMQDKSQADKIKGESAPKNPGKKDGEIKKGQDGLDYKWDAKAKTWSRVEVEEPTSTSDFKISSPIKQGSKDKKNIKIFQQLVVDKMKSLKGNAEYDNLVSASGQFGAFGKKTAAAILFLKRGFELKDTTSDITQELIDKIQSDDGKVKESYSLHEEFNLKAAKAGGGSKTNDVSKKEARGSLKSGVKEIIKGAPKVSKEKVLSAVEKAKAELRGEFDRELTIRDLLKIGAVKNKEWKDSSNPIANTLGFRFYDNGCALRNFDKMFGWYDVNANTFKGNDKTVDDLAKVAKNGIPDKYMNAYWMFLKEPDIACKKYIGWSTDTISTLDRAWKVSPPGADLPFVNSPEDGVTLDKWLRYHLNKGWFNNGDYVDAFRKKFASVLS
jgi:hypothetical protein